VTTDAPPAAVIELLRQEWLSALEAGDTRRAAAIEARLQAKLAELSRSGRQPDAA
jgi:hypothetical protein